LLDWISWWNIYIYNIYITLLKKKILHYFEILTLHKVLRRFGPDNGKFILIFIYDFESWTKGNQWEFLSKKKYQIAIK